jgi:aldehyde:ferredoxin oxidoreductase
VFGYHGRYLRVDAGSGSSRSVSLDERSLREILGGVGLGTALLAREAPTGIDPLSSDAALVIARSWVVLSRPRPSSRWSP